MSAHKRTNGQWGTAQRHSVFAFYPREFTPRLPHYKKIRFPEYCRLKNISRDQAKTLINKKWLAVTKVHGRLWVHEVCPDEINQFFGCSP
ncbi:hypothetical protein D082_04910 [Synechocystis sp. PCC 6714]|nr:hypothetical protein D082_04910 [Synechocystis sp. PCC 6714]